MQRSLEVMIWETQRIEERCGKIMSLAFQRMLLRPGHGDQGLAAGSERIC